MPTPEERAGYLHGKLIVAVPDATVWDQICYASQLLGALSFSEPALEDVARQVVIRVTAINELHNMDNLPSCLPSKTPESTTPSPESSDSTPTSRSK